MPQAAVWSASAPLLAGGPQIRRLLEFPADIRESGLGPGRIKGTDTV